MTETQLTREEWLAKAPRRSPEFEQARFAKDTPSPDRLPIDEVNPYNSHLFREDRWQAHFARLRAEDPVHLNELGSAGRYWSITTWDDVRAIEGDWKSFSSAQGITLGNPIGTPLPEDALPFNSFITMDPPEQTEQRKTVRGISAPSSLRNLDDLIRERTINVLDSLPEGETFDWVDTVSIELTTLMLATLFDFPMEDRRKNPGFDLVSMLAHGEPTKDMSPMEHLGNLILLIVGGNDTTRNTMSGSVYSLNKWPDQYDKLIADPGLISNFVPEVIRWQTPLAYMRRTANHDVEFKVDGFGAGYTGFAPDSPQSEP